jgi:hypothetical protein
MTYKTINRSPYKIPYMVLGKPKDGVANFSIVENTSNFSLSVSFTGVTYQWYTANLDGSSETAISGATNDTLSKYTDKSDKRVYCKVTKGAITNQSTNYIRYWTPSDTTTALWLNMRDTSRIVKDGSQIVTSIADQKDATLVIAQSNSGLRPTFDTVNNCINFPSGKLLELASRQSLMDSSGQYLVFFVEQVIDPTSALVLLPGVLQNISTNANTTLQKHYSHYYNRTPKTRIANSYGQVPSFNASTTNGKKLITHSMQGTSLKLFINGGQVDTTKTIAPQTNATHSLFSMGDLNSHAMQPKFFELIQINGASSDTIRQKIEGYLYYANPSISGALSTGHPFETYPPYLLV